MKMKKKKKGEAEKLKLKKEHTIRLSIRKFWLVHSCFNEKCESMILVISFKIVVL